MDMCAIGACWKQEGAHVHVEDEPMTMVSSGTSSMKHRSSFSLM